MPDFFGSLGDDFPPLGAPQPEKGVQLHGRLIDGRYYVRAEDVAALLELNGVLPKAAARLRAADA